MFDNVDMQLVWLSGAYCIKLLPYKNSRLELCSYGKVNGKIVLTGIFRFYQSFSPAEVLCNRPQIMKCYRIWLWWQSNIYGFVRASTWIIRIYNDHEKKKKSPLPLLASHSLLYSLSPVLVKCKFGSNHWMVGYWWYYSGLRQGHNYVA